MKGSAFSHEASRTDSGDRVYPASALERVLVVQKGASYRIHSAVAVFTSSPKKNSRASQQT